MTRNNPYMLILDQKANDKYWSKISKTNPSDDISLEYDSIEALKGLWQTSDNEEVPTDIFFAGSIPLMDCNISIIDHDNPEDNVSVRVVIFEDYQKVIVSDTGTKDGAIVGALIAKQNGGAYVFFLLSIRNHDTYLSLYNYRGYHGMSYTMMRAQKYAIKLDEALTTCGYMLSIWYSIEIALLHPVIKDVFLHPKKDIVYDPSNRKSTSHGKRVTRYIKKHYINADDLTEVQKRSCSERGFTRKAACWYVIGHWRKLKNGRKIFIKGYWKGPLRELKIDFDGRDREIVIDDKEEKS